MKDREMHNIYIFLSAASVITAALGLIFVRWLVMTSGRDRPHDPERLRRFIDKVGREERAEFDSHKLNSDQ